MSYLDWERDTFHIFIQNESKIFMRNTNEKMGVGIFKYEKVL